MPVNGTFSGGNLWCIDRAFVILCLCLRQNVWQAGNDCLQQIGIQLGKPVMQGASGFVRRYFTLQCGNHRSRIQPRLHAHRRHTSACVASGDCPLDGCRAAPAWQQRGMSIDAAMAWHIQHGLWQQQPIGDNDQNIGIQCGQFVLRIGRFE